MFGSSNDKNTGPVFPIFLLPSLPILFRRRKPYASSSSTSTAIPTPVSPPPLPPKDEFTSSKPWSFSTSSRSNTWGSTSSGRTSGSEGGALPSLSGSPTSTDSSPLSSPASSGRGGALSYFFPPDSHALGKQPLALPTSPTTELAVAIPPAAATAVPAGKPRLARALPDTLRCATCSTDLAYGAQILSKGFTGRHGRAYLVSATPAPALPTLHNNSSRHPAKADGAHNTNTNLVNIKVGRAENRQLVTGAHVVADISCRVCGAKLGWKYVDAEKPLQKYKVGKFILETARVVGFRSWEDGLVLPVVAAVAAAVAPVGRKGGVRGSLAGLGWLDGPGDKGKCLGAAAGGIEHRDEDEVVFDSEDEDDCEDLFAGTWDADVVAKRRRGRAPRMLWPSGV